MRNLVRRVPFTLRIPLLALSSRNTQIPFENIHPCGADVHVQTVAQNQQMYLFTIHTRLDLAMTLQSKVTFTNTLRDGRILSTLLRTISRSPGPDLFLMPLGHLVYLFIPEVSPNPDPASFPQVAVLGTSLHSWRINQHLMTRLARIPPLTYSVLENRTPEPPFCYGYPRPTTAHR